jgi:hypothetical protein
MRNVVVIIATALLVSALVMILFGRATLSSDTQALTQTMLPTISPYDPAQYGIPITIAGYKVLAVLTPGNTACMLPGHKRLILQAGEQDVENFLKNSHPNDINTALVQYGLTDTASWEVQVVGPGTTLDGFLSENQKWNAQATSDGCVKLGPMGPTRTPTP